MISLPEKLIFPVPFAGGEGSELTPIALTPIEDATDAAKVNFFDGFPSSYSAPHENGGNFVTRGQLNAIGNLASKNEYYRMCGGINTFDPVFAQKIGGYPKDAILDYYNGTEFLKIKSLVGNNTLDFRTNNYEGYWILLNQGSQSISSLTIYENDIIALYALNGAQSIVSVVAPRSGIISCEISNVEISEDIYRSSSYGQPTGQGLLGRVFSSGESIVQPNIPGNSVDGNYNGYKWIPGLPSKKAPPNCIGKNAESGILSCNQGDVIFLFIQNNAYKSSYYGNDYSFHLKVAII